MKVAAATILAAALALGISPAAEASGPELTWLRTECQLGAFNEADGPVDCEFPFVNTGDEPLVITSVRTSCGCTSVEKPRGEVAPGDTSAIRATYDPALNPGRFEKQVVVTANTEPAKYRLTLRGTVIGAPATMQRRYPEQISPALRMESRSFAMGTVNKGSAKTEYLEMYNNSSDTITPAFEAVPGHIRLTPGNASGKLPPGETGGWSLVYLPDATDLYGIVADTLRLIPGDGSPAAPIEVVADIREDFSVVKEIERAPVARIQDERLDFGDIPAGSTKTLKTSITNLGKSPLRIHRAYTLDRGLKVKVKSNKLNQGKKTDIIVEVDPSQLPADAELLSARIAIITNDPSRPIQTLRAVGQIIRP